MWAPLKQYTWAHEQYPRTPHEQYPGPTWGQSERERSKSWSVSIVLNSPRWSGPAPYPVPFPFPPHLSLPLARSRTEISCPVLPAWFRAASLPPAADRSGGAGAQDSPEPWRAGWVAGWLVD